MLLVSTGRIPVLRKDKENEAEEKEREKEPPAITPRLTKADALRLGLERPATSPGKKCMPLSVPLSKSIGPNVNGSTKSGGSVKPRKCLEMSANESKELVDSSQMQ